MMLRAMVGLGQLFFLIGLLVMTSRCLRSPGIPCRKFWKGFQAAVVGFAFLFARGGDSPERAFEAVSFYCLIGIAIFVLPFFIEEDEEPIQGQWLEEEAVALLYGWFFGLGAFCFLIA